MNQNQQPVSAAQAGKAYRMGRIFGLDGKTVVLPLDHGSMLGRVSGLEDPLAAIETFLPLSCDGFLIGPGLTARSASLFANRNAPARLLTIDSYWKAGDVGTTAMIAGVSTAAALGADAVEDPHAMEHAGATAGGHRQHGLFGRGGGCPSRHPGYG